MAVRSNRRLKLCWNLGPSTRRRRPTSPTTFAAVTLGRPGRVGFGCRGAHALRNAEGI